MLGVEVEVEPEPVAAVFVVEGVEGAEVILVAILELDDDAAVFGDQPPVGEGDVAAVVVDHVILFQPSFHQLSVDEHLFGAGQYDEEALAFSPFEAIRPLIAFLALNEVAGELAAGHCDAGAGIHPGPVGELKSLLIRSALQFFEVVGEIAVRAAQFVVAGDQFAVAFLQLDEDLVELVELLGIALRLDGDVLVGDGGEQFDAVADLTGHLKVETRIQHQTLAVAEGDATREVARVVERAEVEAGILLVVGIVEKRVGCRRRVALQFAGVDPADHIRQYRRKDPVADPHFRRP